MIMENDDRDRDADVPESWEEANEKSQQALESKIEEAKLKNRLLSKNANNSSDVGSSVSSSNSVGGASVQTSSASRGGGSVMPIRILKRPESAGDLESMNKPNTAKPSTASTNNQMRRSSGTSGSASSSTKSLEERATAYAQARERIFGVVDPVIHEDLPVQPKIMPRTSNNPVSLKPSNT